MATAIKENDDPTVVNKVIGAAATDTKPKLRCIGPARVFDKQIRKLNRLAS
jgi:hypothetical protein